MGDMKARITALGLYVPERILTNADLERIVDTSDEWIQTRTGIRERHVVEPGTPTSELAVRAARRALERRGVGPEELDLIIVATVTPDMLLPPPPVSSRTSSRRRAPGASTSPRRARASSTP